MSGELTKADLIEALEPVKVDLHLLKEGIFNPDKGLYARVERNTIWRKIHMYIYGAMVTAMAMVGFQHFF